MKKNKVITSMKKSTKRKALVIASMASMLDNFNLKNIELLDNMGYDIILAANFKCEDSNSDEKINNFYYEMNQKGYKIIQIDFSRYITNIKKQICSFKQLRKLAEDRYDLIHCNSPICAAMTRFVFKKARKEGCKVIYTAHGFHFYKGAPIKNWLIFYPIEKICSRWTDVLITINKEDFYLAKKRMNARRIEYMPGVGVDVDKFKNCMVDISDKRKEMNIPNKAFLLLSVGELNKNKNHEIVIRAIAALHNTNIHYAIAGKGVLNDYLLFLAKEAGIEDQVHILGFREDVAELYKIADAFVHPSFREGLSVAVMEAMSSIIPIIVSKVRGNTDLINEKSGYLCTPSSINDFKKGILRIYQDVSYRENIKKNAYQIVSNFDIKIVEKRMKVIYSKIGE